MLNFEEILYGGFMILLGFFVIIIARKISHFLHKNDIDLSKMNDMHSWSELDILLKIYSCHICGSCLTGNHGKQCDNCGVYCHNDCIKLAAKTVRCKDVYSLNEEQNMKHHWVTDGKLILDFSEIDEIICCVCNDECNDTENSVSQCCWCQRIRHSYCELNMNICDLGKYKNYVIPPFCVTPTKPNRFNRKFKVKCLSHPGWDGWSPVIVLANCRAGNSDGAYILSCFRRILNPCQVIDLATHSPSLIEKWCSVIPPNVTLNILVAGGDGTVAWILNTLNEFDLKSTNCPPVGIIPLGTGNDLSRILGWGKVYDTGTTVTSYLDKIVCSDVVNLDRWRVSVKSLRSTSLPLVTNSYCYNYFSVGVDAKVALDFHQMRQTSSFYLNSRFYNQILYTIFGTRQLVVPEYIGLQNQLELYLDGVKVTSVPSIESIVIINIPSWGGGVKLWNDEPDTPQLLPQKIDDGRLEVVGIHSSAHMAQLQLGLSKPYYIGQASEITIRLHETLPVQSDGEPWVQKPAEIRISLCNQAKVLKL